jgi:hypothetical protein
VTNSSGTPAQQSSGERVYLFQVIAEPEETPVLLTQRDLDMIIDVGASLPVSEPADDKDLVDFAVLETSDGGPFLYHGHEVPDTQIVAYLQRGMAHLVGRLANALEVKNALEEASDETSEVEHLSEETPGD